MTKKFYYVVGIASILIFIAGLSLYFYLKADIDADQPVASQDYTLFSKPTFDYVYSNTEPNANEIIGKEGISTFAAKGEIEPITFSVRAKKDLGNINIDISDLISDKDRIYSRNIEVLNVKTWQQCLSRVRCNQPEHEDFKSGEVPELLVKDNEQDIAANERGWVKEDDIWRYYPPKLNENFNLNLTKNQSHTFYLKINVPSKIPSGDYNGKISFKPANSESFSFKLNLKILPFNLPESGKDQLVFFQKKTPNELTRDLYGKYLDLFRESGIDGIVSYQTDRKEAAWTAKQLKEKGFEGPILVMDWQKIDELKKVYQSQGFEIYFTGYGEPYNEEKIKEHIQRSQQIHSKNENVFVSITKECADLVEDPNFDIYQDLGIEPVEKIDLPLYSLSGGEVEYCKSAGSEKVNKRNLVEYLDGLWEGKIEKNNQKEYYYTQIWQEREAFHRPANGFMLWASKLDGISPYGVQRHYRPIHGVKQYDDFDSGKSNWNSLYSSTKGPVLTLQWEGFREGIDDTRYLTKLDQLLNRLEKTDKKKTVLIKDSLETKLSNYRLKTSGSDQPWDRSDNYHQNTREWIAGKIIEVQNILNPSFTSAKDNKSDELINRQNFPSSKELIATGGGEVSQSNQDRSKALDWLYAGAGILVFAFIVIGLLLLIRKNNRKGGINE
jgi:hypothetical protein